MFYNNKTGFWFCIEFINRRLTDFEFLTFFFATLELILFPLFIWDIDHIFDEHFKECLVVAAGINIVGMY